MAPSSALEGLPGQQAGDLSRPWKVSVFALSALCTHTCPGAIAYCGNKSDIFPIPAWPPRWPVIMVFHISGENPCVPPRICCARKSWLGALKSPGMPMLFWSCMFMPARLAPLKLPSSSSKVLLRASPVLLRGFVSLTPGGRPLRLVTVQRSHAVSIESTPVISTRNVQYFRVLGVVLHHQ